MNIRTNEDQRRNRRYKRIDYFPIFCYLLFHFVIYSFIYFFFVIAYTCVLDLIFFCLATVRQCVNVESASGIIAINVLLSLWSAVCGVTAQAILLRPRWRTSKFQWIAHFKYIINNVAKLMMFSSSSFSRASVNVKLMRFVGGILTRRDNGPIS